MVLYPLKFIKRLAADNLAGKLGTVVAKLGTYTAKKRTAITSKGS